MINLCNYLLLRYKPQAIPADIAKTSQPIPAIDISIEVDVAPIIAIESTDSNIMFRVLYSSKLFFDI